MSLSITLIPSHTFPAGIPVTLAALRKAASPTVSFVGTVSNSDLAAGSVTSTKVTPGAFWYGIDGQGSDAYAVSYASGLVGYTEGLVLAFRPQTKNTGPATLNANSLGAIAIKKWGGQDLDTGDIKANQVVEVRYGSLGYFEMMNPPGYQLAWQQMVPASPYVGGEQGVVPAPQAGANTFFLRGDATWVSIQTQVNTAVAASPTLTNTNALRYYFWR